MMAASALLCEVLAVVVAYSGLASLLTMRGTCSALHRRAGPERRELWAAARPADRRALLRMGTVECAQLLFRAYSFTADEVRTPNNWALAAVCYHTPTSVAKWAFDYFGVGTKPNDEQWLNDIVGDLFTCANFRMPTMKWISSQYNIKPNSISLDIAYSDGNVAAARWVLGHIAATEYRKPSAYMFAEICKNNLTTARWLMSRFGIRHCTSGTGLDGVFCTTCGTGRTRSMRWLAEHFPRAQHSRSGLAAAVLLEACRNGRTVNARLAARLAVAHFGFTPNGAQRRELLSWTCARDLLATVRWIVGRFGAGGPGPFCPENRTERWLRGRRIGAF